MMMNQIRCAADIERLVHDMGFLPFFCCGISGFSIEELTAREYWFSEAEDGPWEWKGPIIREGHCAYGKIFHKRAGFVSLEWLPDLINYRRSKVYAKDEDTAALDDVVLQAISAERGVTVKELRRMLGFVRGKTRRTSADLVDSMPHEGKLSLEPILTRLMMGMHIVIADFEYNIDRHGRPYGWGVARYTLPETLYGRQRAECSPEESYERICSHLCQLFPDASVRSIRNLID